LLREKGVDNLGGRSPSKRKTENPKNKNKEKTKEIRLE
jgi:hypothetical protein